MSWVRLDDRFHHHPKVVAVCVEARWLYVAGLCWANEHGDEVIPHAAMPVISVGIRRPAKVAQELCGVGLWHAVPAGYQIHDFTDYLPAFLRQKINAGKAGGRPPLKAGGKQNAISLKAEVGSGGHFRSKQNAISLKAPYPYPYPYPKGTKNPVSTQWAVLGFWEELSGQTHSASDVAMVERWAAEFPHLDSEAICEVMRKTAAWRAAHGRDPMRRLSGFRSALQREDAWLADQGASKVRRGDDGLGQTGGSSLGDALERIAARVSA